MSLPSEMDEYALKRFYANFTPPPDAPVFSPSEEEFKDPLAYINQIRPVAQTYGVVKIRTPESFIPPFMIDAKSFRFEPRVQKLNELEAISRVRLNFINRLARFWQLKGDILRVSLVDGQPLDYYLLHKIVTKLGGHQAVCLDRKWSEVCRSMSPAMRLNGTKYGAVVKGHYERWLLPYEQWTNGEVGRVDAEQADCDLKKPGSAARKVDNACAGRPGMRSGVAKRKGGRMMTRECSVCHEPTTARDSIKCAVCAGTTHSKCASLPKISPNSKSCQNEPAKFYCAPCFADEMEKDCGYGFAQAEKDYTLIEFGRKAKKFKVDFFKSPDVQLEKVEKEFWRLVVDSKREVAVEYGADIFSEDKGSGFPKECDIGHDDEFSVEEYVHHPWNLNNISKLPESVLAQLPRNINGMMSPWVYIGMCFSAFCWHTEDHWTYSINYQHWGDSKVWYGISGEQAALFEDKCREVTPELFKKQPDLLHHIVTIMNPAVMRAMGVPIYRVVQEPGDFVVTFPRAYHAGFNTGFNCNEAVNFAPADWLPMGRCALDDYARFSRVNVFSHEELVTLMARRCRNISMPLAIESFKELLKLVEANQINNRRYKELGIAQRQRCYWENERDEERVCSHCNSILYMSGVVCGCESDKRRGCPRHADKTCDKCLPSTWTVHYRYDKASLEPLVKGLIDRTEPYENWLVAVQAALAKPLQEQEQKAADVVLIEELRAWERQAKMAHYPPTDTFVRLCDEIRRADAVGRAIDRVLAGAQRRSTRNSLGGGKIPLSELEKILVDNRSKLTCHIPQFDALQDLISAVRQQSLDINDALGKLGCLPSSMSVPRELDHKTEVTDGDSDLLESPQGLGLPLVLYPKIPQPQCSQAALQKVNSLIDRAESICAGVHLSEVATLHTARNYLRWLVECDRMAVNLENAPQKVDNDECSLTKGEPDDDEVQEVQPDQEVTCEHLRVIIAKANEFDEDSAVISRRERLKCWLEEAERNEAKAQDLLSLAASSNCSLASDQFSEAVILLAAMRRPGAVRTPSAGRLAALVSKVTGAKQRLNHLMDGFNAASLDAALAATRQLAHDSLERQRWQQCRDALQEMHNELKCLFLLSPSFYTLSDILCARLDLPVLIDGTAGGLQPLPSNSSSAEQDWALHWGRVHSIDAKNEALLRQDQQELKLLGILRQTPAYTNTCACGRGTDVSGATLGGLVVCTLCSRRFHATCVTRPLPHRTSSGGDDRAQPILPDAIFLCLRCCRSRRPTVDQVQEVVQRCETALDAAHPGANPKVSTLCCELSVLRRALDKLNDWRAEVRAVYTGPSPNITTLVTLLLRGLIIEMCTAELHTLCGMVAEKNPAFTQTQRAGISMVRRDRTDADAVDALCKHTSMAVGTSGMPDTAELQRELGSGKRAGADAPAAPVTGAKRRRSSALVQPKVVAHDDNSKCEADQCVQPIGNSLNWVQCDREDCNRWYHLVCVQLSQQEAQSASYVCDRCTMRQVVAAAPAALPPPLVHIGADGDQPQVLEQVHVA